MVQRDSSSAGEPDASIGHAEQIHSDTSDDGIRIRTDGPVLVNTMEELAGGYSGDAVGILQYAVDQATTLVSSIVQAYETRVRRGEVGFEGQGISEPNSPIRDAAPTGLLYGRIQSGKTLAMILASALAIDNGFGIVVVLTSDNRRLVQQTMRRFKALVGPLVFSSNEQAGGEYEWVLERENIVRRIRSNGVVFICAKNQAHLRSLIQFLRDIGAERFPALIMDDEADQATPDTTLAARTAGRAGAPTQGSTTFRLTVENDSTSELGFSLREVLRHNVFIQVTATPYALLLQNIDSPLRPSFSEILHPGEGYTGGETFFASAVLDNPMAQPPLVYVDENESSALASSPAVTPTGLERSIAFFLLAAAAHSLTRGGFPADGYKHLCHTSPRTAAHDAVADLVRTYTNRLADELDVDVLIVARRRELVWAFEELSRSVSGLPTIVQLLNRIRMRLVRRRVMVINAQGGEGEFEAGFNFMIGGNILGRGLTIDDLLVTYYLRQARATQMDTMLQHARMYGYRGDILPYVRVFLPQSLALRFRDIHDTETRLRELLDARLSSTRIPVSVVGQLRPTRPGILETRSLGAYVPGQQVYPLEVEHSPTSLGTLTERLERFLRDLGVSVDGPEFLEVGIGEIVEIIQMIRVADPGSWDSEAIVGVLRSIGQLYGGRGFIRARSFRPNRLALPTGAASSAEQQGARRLDAPALLLFRCSGDYPPWEGAPFWYPTVVFPPSMPTHVFNFTDA
jgi:hypothetical protein